MAATVTANATSPRPTGQGFGGDEFSNNLFSDLAPLLTLFGEQVTKQFLSMSMGWLDDVLLAMGPLGIMTVIVSAIRVGGVKFLKAFVGRARESRANAEKEILSSTSEDVCELWSGQEIVRELGNPEGMKDLVLMEKPVEVGIGFGRPRRRYPGGPGMEHTRVLDINSAVHNSILSTNLFMDDEHLIQISNGAPNIALNVRKSTASTKELVVCATLGTILQIGALVFPGVTTYHLKWTKGGSPIAGYGYPCFAIGTLAVTVGMIFCGRVIEGSTTEHEFAMRGVKEGTQPQLMRLQKACTVSDQHFPSFAIFNSPKDLRIRTSRLNNVSYSGMTAVATLATVVGFVAQFVGLRALHWSATIYQLGVMLIMTIARSVVRRGLAEDPVVYSLLDGHELAWLTLYILRTDERGWKNGKTINTTRPSETAIDPMSSSIKPTEEPSAVDQAYAQSIESSETDPSDLESVKEPRLKTLPFQFKRTFPYIERKSEVQRGPHPDAEDRMLDAVVRWEPLTGYWNVKDLRKRLKSTIAQTTIPSRTTMFKTERARLSQAYYPLPISSSIVNAANSPVDYQALNVYRDLQRLMPTPTEATDVANALALAMERTMALLARSNHVLWREGQNPFTFEKYDHELKQFVFRLNIMRGSYHHRSSSGVKKLDLRLNSKRPDPEAAIDGDESNHPLWTADRDALSSVLSLWLFALELRKTATGKAAIALRTLATLEEAEAPELLSRRNVFFRIVGPGEKFPDDQDVPNPKERFNRWLSTEVETVPLLGRENLDRTYDGDFPREPDNMWVVWGSSLSALFHPQSAQFSDSSDLPEYDLAVRTRPDTTIAGHCALELLFYFLDAVAARMEKIGGRTRSISDPLLDTYRYSNTVLESIANECVAAGLAHDAKEAYTVIVPVFLKHNLLPWGPHDEVMYSRDDKNDAIAEMGGNRYPVPVPDEILYSSNLPEEKIRKYVIT